VASVTKTFSLKGTVLSFSTHIAEGCLYLLKFLEIITQTFVRISQLLERYLRRDYENECNDYSWCKDTTTACKLNFKRVEFTFALKNANQSYKNKLREDMSFPLSFLRQKFYFELQYENELFSFHIRESCEIGSSRQDTYM
jgi:hypothetical protein